MDKTTAAGSPLRQRTIEDMRMRKLESRTQQGYIRAVRKLAEFLKRSPDTATVEDLRNFQLHLVDTGTSPITFNATLTGLEFFFDTTLGRGELMARMQPVKLPRTVPLVLSMQEAAALIAAARNIKHRAALSVAYGSGLRASEDCRLKGPLTPPRFHAQQAEVPGQRGADGIEVGQVAQSAVQQQQQSWLGGIGLGLVVDLGIADTQVRAGGVGEGFRCVWHRNSQQGNQQGAGVTLTGAC